jgi:hypothetical protein
VRFRRLAPLSLALLAPALLAIYCHSPVTVHLPDASGRIPVEVRLRAGTDASAVRVELDGSDVRAAFAAEPLRLVGSLPLPAPGAHRLRVRVPVLGGRASQIFDEDLSAPEPAAALVASEPVGDAADVPRTAWLRLVFDAPPSEAALDAWGFQMECDGVPQPRDAHRVAGNAVILNPRPELPPGASCRSVWRGPGGVQEHRFAVADDAGGAPATLLYDREDVFALRPFPDDYWLVEDATTPSGRRLQIDVGDYGGGLFQLVVEGVAACASDRDGFSPVQPMVLAFSDAVGGSTFPMDEFDSLDPFAPLALFDVDPASPDYGERIPFTARVRNDRRPDGDFDHTGILFPAVMLREGGRYALVATRRLFAQGQPGRPFAPSDFFARVAAPPVAGETPQVARARESIGPVLDFLEQVPAVPIPREDVALALRVSVRSERFDPSDLVAVKEAALAAPPPALDVDSVTSSQGRAAILRGSVELPRYVIGSTGNTQVQRDPDTGAPVADGSDSVPFVLTLPPQAEAGPVPIVMYQHGSPGSPGEILSNDFLNDAGYAMIGIQDVDNRTYGQSIDALTAGIFTVLTFYQRLPLNDFQTFADMYGLLRAIQGLGDRSWLPLGAPDAVPEVDTSRILYRGISQGSNYSLGFLPLAPEILAAAPVVGAGRVYQNIIHQVDTTGLIAGLQSLVPEATPGLIFFGLAVIQNDADRQDSHYLARNLYREPLAVAGQGDATPPSLLWIEGIGDTWVSNTGTRAASDEMGIPLVRTVKQATPILPQVDAPVSENIAPGITAGHYQYDPATTPSCLLFGESEGHYCPQIATEAEAQILHFYATALAGAAEIIDPL